MKRILSLLVYMCVQSHKVWTYWINELVEWLNVSRNNELMNSLRKHNLKRDLSDSPVTLKWRQDHQNWNESVKVRGGYQSAGLSDTASEKKRRLKCSCHGWPHGLGRLPDWRNTYSSLHRPTRFVIRVKKRKPDTQKNKATNNMSTSSQSKHHASFCSTS